MFSFSDDIIKNELTEGGFRVILSATIHDIVIHNGDGNDIYNISTGSISRAVQGQTDLIFRLVFENVLLC